MAAIAQANLFSWDAVEARSDLDRLRLVLDHLPDERVVQYLKVMRGHGRDDYPVRAMWHALLAGTVFQHESLESLLREPARNPSLMDACGFDSLPIQRKPKPQVVTDPETPAGASHCTSRSPHRRGLLQSNTIDCGGFPLCMTARARAAGLGSAMRARSTIRVSDRSISPRSTRATPPPGFRTRRRSRDNDRRR
ncbi:transposase [Thiococcus pfennigii]|uniref:transposase n=1 Tax=Thiococcus pfennigii TaxID=1057 RepID=UPI001F5BE108|nr:transposase [Thiococcus pfennigii]